MNRHLYTTDEFGRSVDQTSGKYGIAKAVSPRRYVSPYNRFFDGYTAVFVPGGAMKKQKAVRIYTGTLYRQELTQKQRICRRLLYAALLLFATAMFILALILHTASNSTWYVVLAAIVPAFFYARLVIALNLYVFSGRELKAHEYKDGAIRLVETARLIDKAVLVPMVASGLLFIREVGSYSTPELIRLFLFVISAAAAKMIGKLENKVEYKEIPPIGAD